MAQEKDDGLAKESAEVANRPTEWWFVEMWYEHRTLFKELVKHLLVFGIVFGTLEGFHWVISKSQLEQQRLHLLNVFHFWGSVVLLVIFCCKPYH